MGDYAQGKLPLFERMIELDPSDMAYALALKANSLYAALTPASLAAAGTNVGENDTTAPVYNMLRDWKVPSISSLPNRSHRPPSDTRVAR